MIADSGKPQMMDPLIVLHSGPSDSAKGFGGVLLIPLSGRGERHVCSHQTHFLGSKYTKNVFKADPAAKWQMSYFG